MVKINKILFNFVRFDFWYFALINLIVTLILPLFVGMNGLNLQESASVMERIFTLIGTLIFLPLFLPETNESTFQLIKTKKSSVQLIFIVRAFLIIFSSLLLLLVHLKMLDASSEMDFQLFFMIEMGNVLFLGGMLTLGYAITKQAILGMMFPIMYYSYCLFVGNSYQYLGRFYLFHFSRFEDTSHFWLLGLSGIVMLSLGIYLRSKRQSND